MLDEVRALLALPLARHLDAGEVMEGEQQNRAQDHLDKSSTVRRARALADDGRSDDTASLDLEHPGRMVVTLPRSRCA